MTEANNDSKRIRRVLQFIGYNYFDSNTGQKVNLSFIDRNPYKYNGERAFTFTMLSSWLNQLTEYSKCSMEIGCQYDVLTRYNRDFQQDYIVAIYLHEDKPTLPSFNKQQ